MLLFYPKRDDLFIRMHHLSHPYATVRDLEALEVRRHIGEHAEYCRRDDNEDRKEKIVEQDARERGRDSDNSERPKPIIPARDVLVLVPAPAQHDSLGRHGNKYTV